MRRRFLRYSVATHDAHHGLVAVLGWASGAPLVVLLPEYPTTSSYAVSLLPRSRGDFLLQYNCRAVVIIMQKQRYSPRHQQSTGNSALTDILSIVKASDAILSLWI